MKSEQQQLRCDSAKELRFKGTDPHLKDTLWGKKVAKANWAGAYYCLAPKCGSVWSHGSIQRFYDFPIDPSWIFNRIEAGKIDCQAAKAELIRCGKRLVRRIADLECWHKHEQERLVDAMIAKAREASRAQLKPCPR